MNKILLCDLSESERKEYCEKYDIDIMMATCNCPYPKDVNGITIFPSTNQLDPKDDLINNLQNTIAQQNGNILNLHNSLSQIITLLNKNNIQ
jgi:hypothetical protein